MTKRHITTDECAADCFGCKCAGISFASAATPNRRVTTVKRREWEKTMTRDLDSYGRLRKAGEHPKRVQGCADAELFSNSDFELTSFNRLSSAKVGAKFDETQKFLTSPDGLQPITPRQPVADQ
jgi:hypothetical protein